MYFHSNIPAYIFLKEWHVMSWKEIIGFFLFVFVLSFTFGCCKELHTYYTYCLRHSSIKDSQTRMKKHALVTLIYVLKLILLYVLTMLIMTFHVGILALVMCGVGLSYFFINPYITKSINKMNSNIAMIEKEGKYEFIESSLND
nr:uncharacterized protein LOC105848648 [Hydra vulgaris]